jgi:hypothetical protein
MELRFADRLNKVHAVDHRGGPIRVLEVLACHYGACMGKGVGCEVESLGVGIVGWDGRGIFCLNAKWRGRSGPGNLPCQRRSFNPKAAFSPSFKPARQPRKTEDNFSRQFKLLNVPWCSINQLSKKLSL